MWVGLRVQVQMPEGPVMFLNWPLALAFSVPAVTQTLQPLQKDSGLWKQPYNQTGVQNARFCPLHPSQTWIPFQYWISACFLLQGLLYEPSVHWRSLNTMFDRYVAKIKCLLSLEEKSTPIFLRPVRIKICLDSDICLTLESKVLEVLKVMKSPFHLFPSTQLATYLVDIGNIYFFL